MWMITICNVLKLIWNQHLESRKASQKELLMAFPPCIVLKPAHSASSQSPFGEQGIEYSKVELINIQDTTEVV